MRPLRASHLTRNPDEIPAKPIATPSQSAVGITIQRSPIGISLNGWPFSHCLICRREERSIDDLARRSSVAAKAFLPGFIVNLFDPVPILWAEPGMIVLQVISMLSDMKAE